MGKPIFNCDAKNRLTIKLIHYLNDKSKIYKACLNCEREAFTS